jgi:hypothetical protein
MTSKWIAAAALVLGLAGGAHATTLVSPPLVADGENVLDCYLVNVGTKPRTVVIHVVARDGSEIETVTTTLGAGEEDVARATADQLPRYCRFDVDGPKSAFRASVLVRQEGVGAISALPAN